MTRQNPDRSQARAGEGVMLPRMKPGAVRLNVADLDRAQSFYEGTIGLETIGGSRELATLGAGNAPVVELVERPGAPARPQRTTGLFHLAILVPSRLELAHALRRVVQGDWSLTGASDHLVSEALYLSDPDGNGIEIYRDRPREEWRYADGQLRMETLPLDLNGVLGELGSERPGANGMPPGTRIGHVHLNVAELEESESFYHGLLGFDVTVRGYPGALFLSTGGYHHHIGLNTWAGVGAPPPPPGSLGLERFELLVDDERRLEELARGLGDGGVGAERNEAGIHTADPSNNRILLRVPATAPADELQPH
jgi:catechol 2,3-dioxygenase